MLFNLLSNRLHVHSANIRKVIVSGETERLLILNYHKKTLRMREGYITHD